MPQPESFSLIREVAIDWDKILLKVDPVYRGFLAGINPRYAELMSSSTKFPIFCIRHENYQVLNSILPLNVAFASAINRHCVHKVAGVKFLQPDQNSLVHDIIDAFDAEVIDIEIDIGGTCV